MTRLRDLSDKEVARLIIEETYNIPTALDDANKLILEEIGKMGTKIRNEEGQEVVITPEDFVRFWK